MASTSRIEVVRGDTLRLAIAITDNLGGVIDLTGSTLYFTVRRIYSLSVDDSDAVFQKSTSSGITITNAVNGVAQLVILPADTVGLAASTMVFDLQVITGAGDTITPAVGQFVVKPDVTRRAT